MGLETEVWEVGNFEGIGVEDGDDDGGDGEWGGRSVG